jgi:chitin synthase
VNTTGYHPLSRSSIVVAVASCPRLSLFSRSTSFFFPAFFLFQSFQMAYRQQNHDPYYGQQHQQSYSDNYHNQQGYNDYNNNNGSHQQGYDYQQHQQQQYNAVPYASPHPATEYPQENHSNWDAKSYQSSYAGSQAHLDPYSVNVPPMPMQQNYPPSPRPGMMHAGSSGYNLAKEKLLKRRSVRQVELYQGNLVLDVPVPSHIVPGDKKNLEEMTTMRYTAATCDPDDFMASKYSLRPYLYGRHTELFIVMTMYNEDEVLFVRTMNSSVSFSHPISLYLMP